MAEPSRRIWRLRKLHQSLDAELRRTEEGPEAGVILQLKLNGELTYARRWPTAAEAVADAASRRSDLERDGWMFHW